MQFYIPHSEEDDDMIPHFVPLFIGTYKPKQAVQVAYPPVT